METKIINNGILKNYNQQIFVTADSQKSSSPIMQYASTPYSSVILTPSTIVSTPSPQSVNSFSPIYTEESDYNLMHANLNSPIKQEQQQLQFVNGNLLPINNQQQNQLIQLNQTNQIMQINKPSKNKRSADDNSSTINVKRGRSRTVESNINQSTNQTNIQLTINKSKEPKLNEQGQIVKPTKVRRTRAKSPTLAKKLQKVRRLKANDRERNRMHTLNKALEKLREILPVSNSLNTSSTINDETSSNCSNKLTKIETLRFANSYIYQLKSLLEMDITQLDPNKSPESRLKEAAMAAAAATNFNSSSNQSHHLLSNSQNSYTNFSSIFQTNCAVSNGILSTTSSLSNDEDDEDLLMLMNGDGLSQNEDIFDQQQQQQIYHLN